MAKKRKSKKKAASRRRKRSIGAAPVRTTRKRSKRSALFTKKKKPRRIGASPKMNTKRLINDAIGGLKTGGAIRLTKIVYPKVPIANPWLKDGLFFVGGVLVARLDSDIGKGIAGQAVDGMLGRVLPASLGGGVSGRVGRRMTADEVNAIEAAAMSDRVAGITDRVVVGNPIMAQDLV